MSDFNILLPVDVLAAFSGRKIQLLLDTNILLCRHPSENIHYLFQAIISP